MTTSTVASTTLDFLETVPPNNSIWDAGGVEALILQISSLAILKRNERQMHGVSEAVAALQVEADSLSSDGIEIDLGPVQSADLASIAPASILPRIEDLLTTIVHRRRGKSTPVSRELWEVAYFLASCGRRVDDGPADPPPVFGQIGWGIVFVSFHQALGAGRDQEQFRKSLSNLRDYYDAFVNSGRRGWNPKTSKMPRLGHIVMTVWKDRPCEELWEYVKQFVTR